MKNENEEGCRKQYRHTGAARRGSLVKYLIFFLCALIGIPLMIMGAYSQTKIRNILYFLLVFSTMLGDKANIFFMSMEHYRGPDRGFEVTLTDLIGIALFVTLVTKYSTRVKWIPFNTAMMLVLFGWCTLSSWGAPEPLFALFTLVKLVKCFMLYFVAVNFIRMGVSRDAVFWSFCSIGIIILLLMVKQRYHDGIYRPYGPFDHSNTNPAFLSMMMPPLFIYGICDRRHSFKVAALLVFGSLAMVVVTVFTLSRLGIALAVLGLAVAFWIAVFRARSVRLGFFGVLMFLGGVGGALKVADSIRERSHDVNSEKARDEFKTVAKMMTEDNALGIGLNNFSFVMTTTPRYRKRLKVMKTETQAGVVHHIYWLTSAEMGRPGLFIFVTMISVFLWHFWVCFFKYKSLDGLLTGGFAIGFIILHLTGFFEWVLRITPVTYMFVITSGLAVALAEKAREDFRLRRHATIRTVPMGAPVAAAA